MRHLDTGHGTEVERHGAFTVDQHLANVEDLVSKRPSDMIRVLMMIVSGTSVHVSSSCVFTHVHAQVCVHTQVWS